MRSKLTAWWPVLLFIAATATLFLPLLWGRVLMPPGTDLTVYYYPAYHFYAEAVHTGQSFLWNPYLFSGFPMYLSQAAGFFDPLNFLLATLFVPPFMLELRLMLDILLTLCVSYGVARALGRSRRASVLASVSYLIAFEWFYLSNPIIANSLFLLPLLLWCAVYLVRGKHTARSVAVGGVGLGWALLGGYTQIVFYAVALVGIYLLVYAFLSRFTIRRFSAVAVRYALIVALGALLAVPQLVPAALFLSHTSRGEAASYAQITLKAIAPGDLLLTLVPPHFYIPYITPGRKALFVGALWMLLGLGALALTARTWRRRETSEDERHLAAIAFIFLFAFIASVQYSPLYYLLNKLPVFSLFRFPFRFMFLGTFLLSLLGAYGFDRAEDLRRSRFFKVGSYVLAVITAVFLGGIIFIQALGASGGTWLASFLASSFNATLHGHFGFTKDAASYARVFEQGLAAYRELLSLSDPGILLPLLCLAASAILAVLFVRGQVGASRFQSAAYMVGLSTFVAVALGGWYGFVLQNLYGYPNAFMKYVVPEKDQYRLYPFLIGEASAEAIPPQYKLSLAEGAATHELASAGGVPNLSFMHGLRSVDGYDQFEPNTTLGAMGRIGGELGAGYGAGTAEERTAQLLSHLDTLGMMSGKYIISGIPLHSSQLSLVATSTVTSYDMTLYLYEYAKAFPHYFLASQDCTSCIPSRIAITPTRAENGHFEFSVTSAHPATLVLTETNLPGWKATLEGKEVPLRVVNELFMGVDIPEGEHHVIFEYYGMLGELNFLRAFGLIRR